MFLAAWQPLPSRSLKNNIRMFFFRLYWSNVEVQFKYDKFLSKELWTFNFVKHFKLDWKTRIYAFCCENISVLNYAFFGVTFWTQIIVCVKNLTFRNSDLNRSTCKFISHWYIWQPSVNLKISEVGFTETCSCLIRWGKPWTQWHSWGPVAFAAARVRHE